MASDPVQFRQQSYSTRTDLSLGPEVFTYTRRRGRERDEVTADYFQIERGQTKVAQGELSALPHALLVLVCGAAFVGLDVYRGVASNLSALWVVPGVISVLLVLLVKTRFIAIRAAGTTLLIIRDKQHTKILQELTHRRHHRLHTLYAPLNLATAPATETRKIEWLVDEGVLTREEADAQLAQIALVVAAKAARAAATKSSQGGPTARLGG